MESFVMCATEEKRLKNWLKTHKCESSQTLETCDSVMTSNYEVCFRPSAVGPSVRISCDCGISEDITHYEHF